MPVRRIRPSKGMNKRCKVTSPKRDTIVHCESTLERDFVHLCNIDRNIKEIEYQPHCISYNHKGKSKNYTPDYKITAQDYWIHIFEVKPEDKLLEDDNPLKFYIGKKFCEEKGWKFHVVTEKDIRPGYLQRNIKLLLKVQKYHFNYADSQSIIEALKHRTQCTISELQSYCGHIKSAIFYGIVYQMLYRQIIYTDMINVKISDDSILSMNKGDDFVQIPI